jgi:hypothetical protein
MAGLVGELRIPKLWEIGRAEVLLRYGSPIETMGNHSNRRIIVSSRLFLYYQVGGPTITLPPGTPTPRVESAVAKVA